jgi:hypothetical protein
MNLPLLRQYTDEAGFGHVEILPDNPLLHISA